MILIVSYPNNEHVDQVRKHLNVDSIVVDTASFPVSLGLSAQMTREREKIELTLPDGQDICLCKVGSGRATGGSVRMDSTTISATRPRGSSGAGCGDLDRLDERWASSGAGCGDLDRLDQRWASSGAGCGDLDRLDQRWASSGAGCGDLDRLDQRWSSSGAGCGRSRQAR